MTPTPLRRLSILMATAFIDMIGFAMVLPLLPFYAVRLGAQEWMVGPLVASFAVAQLASSPVWGRVSDRYGRRPVILAGLFAGAVAYTIFGLADALWLLFLSRVAQGSGGGTTGVIQAYIADSTDPRQRARALGWLSAATSAGVMIGPAIGSLAFTWGAAAPGFVAAGLCLLNLAFASRWLPESFPRGPRQPASAVVPGAGDEAAAAAAGDAGASTTGEGTARSGGRVYAARRSPSIRSALWTVLRHPGADVARLIWIYAVGMGAFTAMTTVLPLFLSSRFGITETTIGYFFFYVGGLSVIMRAVILGPLVDRLGEPRVMRLGATVLALGFTLMPLAGGLPIFVVVASCMPIGTALLFPATSAMVTHRTKRDEMGQTLGVQQAFGGGARVVGPVWGAAAFQVLGQNVPFFVSAGLVALMLIVAMGAAVREGVAEGAAD